MSNFGSINFSEYDSDEFIGTKIYSCKSKNETDSPKTSKNKLNIDDFNNRLNINDLDLEINSASKHVYNESNIINNNVLSDCEIITYDNSNEINVSKSKESEKNIFNDQNNDITSLFCNSKSENLSDYKNESSDENFTVYFDSSKLKKCANEIPIEKKGKKKSTKPNSLPNITHTDVITKKLSTIIDSFRKLSYLVQYYIRILEETKIQVSELEMSQAVKSCCETTNSLFTYLKAEIDKNKCFILDDKYHNREGFNLTNGTTKIYYIEKIQMKLFDSGDAILGIFEENGRILTYELGDNYSNANFEGDLFYSLDVAKQKAEHFNKFIESKFNKISSIFNLQLIYLDKFKA